MSKLGATTPITHPAARPIAARLSPTTSPNAKAPAVNARQGSSQRAGEAPAAQPAAANAGIDHQQRGRSPLQHEIEAGTWAGHGQLVRRDPGGATTPRPPRAAAPPARTTAPATGTRRRPCWSTRSRPSAASTRRTVIASRASSPGGRSHRDRPSTCRTAPARHRRASRDLGGQPVADPRQQRGGGRTVSLHRLTEPVPAHRAALEMSLHGPQLVRVDRRLTRGVPLRAARPALRRVS